jgi:phenylacetate-CoA ligase
VLQERQSARLRALIGTAADTPFYKRRFAEAGVAVADIQSPRDLERLPIVTKQDIRTHGADLFATGVRRSELMEFRTGGSTGTPLIVFATEEVSERRNAAARRSDRWTGWNVGEPVAAVWGNPKLPSTIKERLRHELLEPVIYLDTMALTASAVERFASEWRRARPTLLFGHAHSIYLLACSLRDLGIDAVRPKAVLATSMMLLAPERQVIEAVLGVKVTDRYGCEEVGLIACECEHHRGMHINVDHVVVEFVRPDGAPAAPGEVAQVVVTDLINHAMPLIRYRVEDLAASVATPCACGRGLPLMDRVSGRVADFLVRRDGARVAGVSLIENSLTRIAGIRQMQIVQESIDHIRLRVVPEQGFAPAARTELVNYFVATFPSARVDLELTDGIARETNGKFRFAICKVNAR